MAVQNESSETGTNKGPESSGSGDGVANLQRPPRDQRQQQRQQPAQQQGKQSSSDDEPKRLSLAELFADDGSDPGSESGTDDGSGPVDSVEKLIKRHGLTAEQVYAIKVPMANGGEPMSLGDLKDRVGELVDLEQREAEFDQRRRAGEGDLLRAQAEMRELMALIPKDKLSPELVNKIRQKHEATQAAERRATLEHIPEWKDEKRRTEDIEGMIGLIGDYGFGPEFLSAVVDHRALKMIRDFYLMDRRIKNALAKVKDVKKAQGQRTSGKQGNARRPNNASQNRQARVLPDQNTRIRNLFGDN